MNTEQHEILKNNVGILASNIINGCKESASIQDNGDWSGYEEFEEIYKFVGQIMEQMKITRVDHTKGIVKIEAEVK